MRRSYSQRTASFPRTPTTSFGRAEGRDAPILTGQLRLVGHPELGAGAALDDRYAAEAEGSCRDPAPRVGTIRGTLARRIDVYASEQLTSLRTSPRVSHASPSPRDSRCQRRSRESGADGGRSEARHIPDGRSLPAFGEPRHSKHATGRRQSVASAARPVPPDSRVLGTNGIQPPGTRRARVDRVPESHSPTSTRAHGAQRPHRDFPSLAPGRQGPRRTSLGRRFGYRCVADWKSAHTDLEYCTLGFGVWRSTHGMPAR
jgi:hypothetical protein